MAAIMIEFEGQQYEYDELDLDVDEAETIQKYVGRNLGDFSNGLQTCEVKSVMALWWLLRKRAGQHPGAIAAKIPGFKPVQLWTAFAAGMKAEADRIAAEEAAKEEAAAAADPTRPSPAPSSPGPAVTPTIPAPLPATLSLPG